MPDNVNITVNETIENVVINPSISTDVIDVNTYSTAETINIAVTPELTTVNINSVTSAPQVNSDWNATSGFAQILNKPSIPSIAGLATTTYVDTQDALKVDKVAGSRLITSAESTLLGNTSGINTGDQDLSNLVVKNTAIVAATKTKITYDAKGLVTVGADATTADIADSLNKRYVTDANLTTIGNQSGTNTGDETTATIKTKLGASTTSLDGYLTSTDWNTFNGKFNLPSLTSGSVLFSNGTTIAQDNANLFWNDTNNRLGIGTASPTARLHVAAPGALSTDIALRVRNSADTGDLATIGGTSILTVGGIGNDGSINLARGSNGGIMGAIIQTSTFTKFINYQGTGFDFFVDAATSTQRAFIRGTGVGISGTTGGTFTLDASALLQANSTTQGVLFPRMTTTQKNAIATPATGLVVFDTTLGKLCVRGASAWETITSI